MQKKGFSIPDPLLLALGLTFLTIILAFIYGTNPRPGILGAADVLTYWTKGFWELLAFSMQMVLILLLGYMLALSPVVDRLSSVLAGLSSRPIMGTVIVMIVAIIAGLINWGLALVLGAVLVRKIGEQAKLKGHAINYALLGASAYVCMMVWHGGLSGSAPLSVATTGHFLEKTTGIIPLTETLFSGMNLTASALLLLLLPLATWWFAAKGENRIPPGHSLPKTPNEQGIEINAEENKTVWKPTMISVTGLLLITGFIILSITRHGNIGLNEVNLILFALVFIAFPKVGELSKATEKAIGSTTGIIIQFPLYAGIMGIMNYSGLLEVMTNWFVVISTERSLPLLSFLSASIVNLFVPSGGGQWAVQGPLFIDVAGSIGVSHAKIVLSMAYGDQLTNMLQPFWALPLIGITGLTAGQIFKYSWRFMIIGLIIFAAVLLIF